MRVTLFLDEATPAEVLKVLTRAKELNPWLRISFDHGFDWSEHTTPEVEGILALTDLLFVNYRDSRRWAGTHTLNQMVRSPGKR